MFENFPYTNFHDLNLDWLIQKVKEAYSPDNPPENVVMSVNGDSGDVILYKNAQVALPDISGTQWNIYRGVGDGSSIQGIQFEEGQPAKRIAGTNRFQIYDAGNPPPYPVTQVNGQTGNVVISIPVQSVNGQTGVITLYQSANIAFPNVTESTWNMYRGVGSNGKPVGIQFRENGSAQRIDDTNRYDIYDAGNPPPYPVTSVNTLTGAIAILDTTIVTESDVQKIKITFPVTSVDGQTGAVSTWGYTNDSVIKVPVDVDANTWGIKRTGPSGDIGIKFEYDSTEDVFSGYLTFKATGSNTTQTIKILTPDDIPSSSGVVSINGQTGAVTLTGEDIQFSSQDSTNIAAKITADETQLAYVKTNFATIENSSTSSHNYSEGEYLVLNGILRKVTAAISTGNTIDNSNSEQVRIGSELFKANSNMAYIEANNTASRNYAIGDYFIFNGELTQATANISSGGTIDSTNSAAVVGGLASELAATNDHLAQFSVGFIGEMIGETWVLSSVSQTKTVTEDCWVYAQIGMRNGQGLVGLVDGVSVFNYLELSGNSSAAEKSTIFPMKNGQTLTFASNGNLPSYPYIRFYKMLK